MPPAIIRPGENCWRSAQARRVAFLVDGSAYFRALRAALANARSSVLILGWDLDSRTRLDPESGDGGPPCELGTFLNALAERRPELEIHVLAWDYALVYVLEREVGTHLKLRWGGHERVHFRLDANHPIGASHHQKVVVVDDAIAFAGGLDLTVRRWDTPEHRADDPRRTDPWGRPYGPFHDVQVAVDGEAAAALGDLARARWRRATGEALDPPGGGHEPWPAELAADLDDVPVAVARTEPEFEKEAKVGEVEALYLDGIAAARRCLYVENQYLSSGAIGGALEKRLREEDGPEIVIVLPKELAGWLEEGSVGLLQHRVLNRLAEADRFGRLRVYHPVVANAVPVMVHAKVMVVDDRLVRVGSSNLTNRSMGLDTECDLAVEAAPGSAEARRLEALRDRLLAEHLGVAPERVRDAAAGTGSVVAAIETLRGGARTLVPFPARRLEGVEEVLTEAEILDPNAPLEPELMAKALTAEESDRREVRHGMIRLALILAALAALAALWRWGPFGDAVDAEALGRWGAWLTESWLALPAVVAVFVLAGLAVVPVTALIGAVVLIFEPAEGFAYALAGSLASAAACYALGHALGRKALERLSGTRLHRLSKALARRGVLSMIGIRLVPIAPFSIINLVAGVSHIRFRDFLVGTLAGMAPGILAMTVFAEQLRRVVTAPSAEGAAILAGIVLAVALAALWVQRKLAGTQV